MVVAALAAFRSRAYRGMSQTYRSAAPSDANDGEAAGSEAADGAALVGTSSAPSAVTASAPEPEVREAGT
jgi:hypothetical protein